MLGCLVLVLGEVRLAGPARRAKGLVFEALKLRVGGAALPLQLEVLANRFVEDSHRYREKTTALSWACRHAFLHGRGHPNYQGCSWFQDRLMARRRPSGTAGGTRAGCARHHPVLPCTLRLVQ